jgi:hypothetical protein
MKTIQTTNGADQNHKKVEAMMAEWSQVVNRLRALCQESILPVNLGCRRSNLCKTRMISLFHETKQMGIVLRKSFKGMHVWIPPIQQQIR